MNFSSSMAEVGTVACEINDKRMTKSNSYNGGTGDAELSLECLHDENSDNYDNLAFGRSISFNNRLGRQSTTIETIANLTDAGAKAMHINSNNSKNNIMLAAASTANNNNNNNNNDDDIYHALLTPPNSLGSTIVTADESDCDERIIRRAILRSKNRAYVRTCACPRTFGTTLRTCACSWYINYILSFCAFCAFLVLAYCTRDYARRLLFWIETQNSSIVFLLFIMFFILVSFPIVFGYFLLMITSGYLFGCLKGLVTVILGANLGIAIAHLTMSSLRNRIPIHKIIKNETGRAILRVISGPRAFRVVLFTRLTPIPFGLQNAIFGVSSVNPRIYFTATFLGLLPAQVINVYLGSTLRSMHEVLNNHGTALTGYISIGLEVICGVALMFWVVQKARNELSETLLTDISNDGKLLDIQV